MSILEFDNVSFSYAGSNENVLEEINFSIEYGEFVVLCGQSGCGKSTLLRHTKKNQIPEGNGTGNMYFEGEDIELMDDRKSASDIGFVGQNPDGQIVTDRVYHELAFGLENLGIPLDQMRRRVSEMAEYFGMESIFDKSADELSGGQKQILNLASVMVMRPKLLVLDEPTSQLDPIASEKFIHTLEKINRDFGVTILISEQRLEEILPIADRVIIMHQGRIAGDVLPEETGYIMKKINSPVYKAIPAAAKLFTEYEGEGKSPLTVRDGSKWLKGVKKDSEEIKKDSAKIKKDSWKKWQINEILQDKNNISCDSKNQVKEAGDEIVLKCRNISYSYGPEKVLKDFSADIPKKSIYAILGGNGSGKTTALKIMSGIYKAKKGKVESLGRVIYLPQNPQTVFTEITAFDELMEVYLSHKSWFKDMTDDERSDECERMLRFLELDSHRKKHPFDLSGGQQQRLALGKVLLLKPDILLLDEPTKGLDSEFKDKLSHLLRKLVKEGITIVLVSHDIDFCAETADYCSLLFDGELTKKESTTNFFSNNYFYTTSVNRMFKLAGISDDVITYNQAALLLKEDFNK